MDYSNAMPIDGVWETKPSPSHIDFFCRFGLAAAAALALGIIAYGRIRDASLVATRTVWHSLWANMQNASGVAIAVSYLIFVPLTTAVLWWLLRPMDRATLYGWAKRLLHPARVLAVGGTLLAVWIFAVNRAGPRIYDDTTYLFQARLFASGQVALNLSDLPPGNFYWHWTVERAGRLFSFQMPGHSLLLAPGIWLGAVGLIPLLLYLIGGIAVYRGGVNFFGHATARLALFLFALSPWCLAIYSGYSVSASAAAILACILWAWSGYRRRPAWSGALALGGLMGLLLWTRPTTILFLGLPLAVWTAARLRHRPREIAFAAAALAVFSAMAALLVAYCWSLNGEFSWTPGNVYSARMSGPEYGPANILNPGTLGVMARSLFYLSLIMWPIPFGPVVGLYLARRGWGRRRSDVLWALAAVPALLLVFYAMKSRVLTWYFFEAFPAVCLLTAVLLARTVALARLSRAGARSTPRPQPLPGRLIAAGAAAMLFVALPLTLMREHDYTRSYNVMDAAVAEALGRSHKAVLVLDPAIPPQHAKELLSRNFPDLSNPRVYVSAEAPKDPAAFLAILRKSGADAVYQLQVPEQRTPQVTLRPVTLPGSSP